MCPSFHSYKEGTIHDKILHLGFKNASYTINIRRVIYFIAVKQIWSSLKVDLSRRRQVVLFINQTIELSRTR